MNLFKQNKCLEFHIAEDLEEVVPEPKPATHFFPKWYKEMSTRSDSSDPRSGTMKRCVPIRDAMTLGFIIPLWSDIQINPTEGDIGWTSPFNKDVIGTHSRQQVEGCPVADKHTHGYFPMKFLNPWIIKTPPGYSCMFISPIGHYENRFEVLTGVVDTDVYYNQVNFPFVWKDNESRLLKKGEPLIQAIPFKRENWKLKTSYVDSTENSKTVNNLSTHTEHGYRDEYWQPQYFRKDDK